MLAAEGLAKRYGNVTALAGCSFAAERGRLLGFLGPNGAGKSTAMRAVFGLVALDSGTITWDGRSIGPDDRSSFGYMPEQRGLYPRMRIGDQLAYLAELHGIGRGGARGAAERWLAELDLADRAGEALEKLSHGNQQRVQLAAALVHGPELLVLDEPFSGLDPLGVESLQRVLRREAERGTAIVLSSHQLDLVESMCDDVVVLHQGRQVLSGTLQGLRQASGQRQVEVAFDADSTWDAGGTVPGSEVVELSDRRARLLVPADTRPEDVLRAARGAGVVSHFTFEPPPLSQLFLQAVRS